MVLLQKILHQKGERKIRFLTDRALRQIKGKEFRKRIGITKADYRLLRNLILAGWNLENWSIWIPGKSNNKKLTLHEFCQFLKGIDVIYITRIQKERINATSDK